MCFSPKEKCTSQKCKIFEISAHLIFALCFPPSAARSLKRTKKHKEIEIRFFGPPVACFEGSRSPKFWCGMCDKTAGFYHVLSVSVVPSVSVESGMESDDVLMTCFCAVSLSGTM